MIGLTNFYPITVTGRESLLTKQRMETIQGMAEGEGVLLRDWKGYNSLKVMPYDGRCGHISKARPM